MSVYTGFLKTRGSKTMEISMNKLRKERRLETEEGSESR